MTAEVEAFRGAIEGLGAKGGAGDDTGLTACVDLFRVAVEGLGAVEGAGPASDLVVGAESFGDANEGLRFVVAVTGWVGVEGFLVWDGVDAGGGALLCLGRGLGIAFFD